MKASALQIGDYVNYRGQIIKITSLYDKGDSNEVGWSDKESVWVNADNVKPIPLTPEILEKNGWKLMPDTRNKLEYSWSTGAIAEYADIHIYVGKDHSNVWRWDFPILNIHLYRGDIELTKFRYVHELQHALKLCGIDMEITL